MNLGAARPVVLAPHSFGNTGILDSFDRADEAPLGAASGGDTWGTTRWMEDAFVTMSVVSNKCEARNLDPNQGGQTLNGNYGPDCEVSFTVESHGAGSTNVMWALLRGAIVGTEQSNGYGMVLGAGLFVPGTSVFDVAIFRVTAGTRTYLRYGRIGVVADGDSFGLSAVGTVITAWYKPTGSSVWQARITATDATYAAAGKIGLQLDDPFTIETLRGGTR